MGLSEKSCKRVGAADDGSVQVREIEMGRGWGTGELQMRPGNYAGEGARCSECRFSNKFRGCISLNGNQ